MKVGLRLFGRTVLVTCHDSRLEESLTKYWAPCLVTNPSGDSFAAFELAPEGLRQTKGPEVSFTSAVEPFAQFELAIIRLIDGVQHAGVLLHAACVSLGDRVLILVAPSGGGKSTMTREFLRRGAQYITDDLLQVDEGRLRGLARAIHFDPIDPKEPCPDYWLDTNREIYQLTLDGKRMTVPVWWQNDIPVLEEVEFSTGEVVVVQLERGDNQVRPMTSLERAVVLHESAIARHGEYDASLGNGPSYVLSWNEPAGAAELLLAELSRSKAPRRPELSRMPEAQADSTNRARSQKS